MFSTAQQLTLHLSQKEDAVISALLQQMQQELKNNIDPYSQDVVVSHLDLLLTYANRFYNRQFITRKAVNNNLLMRLEQLLSRYFSDEKLSYGGASHGSVAGTGACDVGKLFKRYAAQPYGAKRTAIHSPTSGRKSKRTFEYHQPKCQRNRLPGWVRVFAVVQ